jgi:hypothetical protein
VSTLLGSRRVRLLVALGLLVCIGAQILRAVQAPAPIESRR